MTVEVTNCEQYVLAELDREKRRNERLVAENAELTKQLDAMTKRAESYKEALDRPKTPIEVVADEAMKERGVVQVPLCFLAKSLENMSLCHAAYFCKGWEDARGCKIEHDAATAYGLEVLYEE